MPPFIPAPRRLALLLAVCTALFAARLTAQSPSSPRLAFLRDGEVWVSDRDGRRGTPVTRTDGHVEDFRVAPMQEYLAFARTVRYVDEPGLFDDTEKPPRRSVQAIAVMRLATRRLLGEIQPRDEWIYLDRWLPGGRLVGHSASGFDVTGVFEFDVATGRRHDLGFEAGARLIEGDVTRDGALTVYVDDAGLGSGYEQRLHLVDRVSGTDTIRASRRSILAPRIANGKSAVAFVEVSDGAGSSRDRVSILNLSTDSVRVVHEDIARSKSWGTQGLSWSPDDRYLAMNYGGAVVIVDLTVGAPPPVQIPGTDACWIASRALVMRGPAGIDVYDVAAGTRRPLVARASRPQCLVAAPEA